MAINESILQFIPKGSYYNEKDEQMREQESALLAFKSESRLLFTLSAILPGTAYSKSRMIFHMLSDSYYAAFQGKLLPVRIGDALHLPFIEEDVIRHALQEMGMPRALKALLMLVKGRVNNGRTRRIILEYLFERDAQSLQSMCVKFRPKVRQLLRHVYGHDLPKVVDGRKKPLILATPSKIEAVRFVCNEQAWIMEKPGVDIAYRMRDTIFGRFYILKGWAKENNRILFMDEMKTNKIPLETAMGLRNCYKLDVDLGELIGLSQKSAKQTMQMAQAAKRHGESIEVDYSKQSIYDLWRIYLHNSTHGNDKDIGKIHDALNKKAEQKLDVDLGKVIVVLDCSRSMEGSPERPMHPFLTGLTIASLLPGVHKMVYAGGAYIKGVEDKHICVPSENTNLVIPFLNALTPSVDTIMVISDGYENSIKGAVNAVYEAVRNKVKRKDLTKETNVIHVNPVYAAEAKGARRLFKDIAPLMVGDVSYLFSALAFRMLATNKDAATRMLLNEYRKITGKARGEGELLLS